LILAEDNQNGVSAISLDAHECGLLQRDAEY
jgi:hypothetical protein